MHHAHLAHALARPARALRCYRAAAHHSEPGSFVNVAARAGEIALCVGVQRRKASMGDAWRQGLSETDEEWTEEDDAEELETRGAEVIEVNILTFIVEGKERANLWQGHHKSSAEGNILDL